MLGHSPEGTGLSDPVSELVDEFEREWEKTVPLLERYVVRLPDDDRAYGHAELVRVDLQQRYKRGLKPSAREYFDRFPELTDVDGRAISIIYEEYCLRVENNEVVETSEFCMRYSTWRQSLVSQLAYHRDLSKADTPPPLSAPFPDEGEDFGDFELVKLLGLGGASRVFLARAKLLGGMEVVLKISHDRGDESAIMGRLDHDHIVPINTSFVDEKTGFRVLSMPYRPGLTLDRVIAHFRSESFRNESVPHSSAPLRELIYGRYPDQRSEEERSHGWKGFPSRRAYHFGVAWIGLKLAEALAHAHSRGVYHRDVKPDNVLLSCRCGPQFIDFNLAHNENPADQARAAHRGGTLPYMAREQLQAFIDPKLWSKVGSAADLFSLGLILRELLTLRLTDKPDMSRDVPRVINDLLAKRSAPLVSLRKFNSNIPHALDSIINHLLAESPEARYQNGEALAEDLRRFLERKPLLTARNPSRLEVTSNWILRRSRTFAAVGAALLLLGFLVIQAVSFANKPPTNKAAISAINNLPQDALGDSTLALLKRAIEERRLRNDKAAEPLLQKVLLNSDAEDVLSTFCEENPNSTLAISTLGHLFLRKQKFESAESVFTRLIVLEPEQAANYYSLAQATFKQGKIETALANSHAAEKRLPAQVGGKRPTWFYGMKVMLGLILCVKGEKSREDGQFAEAERLLKQAIVELDVVGPRIGGPVSLDYVLAYQNYSARTKLCLAQTQSALGRNEEALTSAREAKAHLLLAEELVTDKTQLKPLTTSIEDVLVKIQPPTK